MIDVLLWIHSLGVIHNDMFRPNNIILIRSREECQVPVIIDFGRARSPLEHPFDPNPLQTERRKLFDNLKRVTRSILALQCFEHLIAEKEHDREWKSFMVDMDERRLTEWKVWEEKN